jgi:hypothetical protein
MASRIGRGIKKLLRAAAKAAKGKGPLPPLLWKKRLTNPPGWREFDAMSYREIVTATALENVYQVVETWARGKADPEIMKYYAKLVGAGIAGKDVN